MSRCCGSGEFHEEPTTEEMDHIRRRPHESPKARRGFHHDALPLRILDSASLLPRGRDHLIRVRSDSRDIHGAQIDKDAAALARAKRE